MFSLCGHLMGEWSLSMGEWSLSVFKRVHFCVVIRVVFAISRSRPGQTLCSTLPRAGDRCACVYSVHYMCTHVKLFVVHSRHLSSVQCLVKCVRVCVHTLGQMMPWCLAAPRQSWLTLPPAWHSPLGCCHHRPPFSSCYQLQNHFLTFLTSPNDTNEWQQDAGETRDLVSLVFVFVQLIDSRGEVLFPWGLPWSGCSIFDTYAP